MCIKVSIEEVVLSKVSRVNEQHTVRLVSVLQIEYVPYVILQKMKIKKFYSEIVHFVITLKSSVKIA